MSVLDQCLERMAHLDRADRLLNEVRVYNTRMPIREALAQHRALLTEARRQADGIVTAARADAERFREEMKQQATAQAAGIVERAEREIQRETARAVAQLRQEAVDLSFAIASKVLRRTVTPADHERLLDEVIGTLEQPSEQRPS